MKYLLLITMLLIAACDDATDTETDTDSSTEQIGELDTGEVEYGDEPCISGQDSCNGDYIMTCLDGEWVEYENCKLHGQEFYCAFVEGGIWCTDARDGL